VTISVGISGYSIVDIDIFWYHKVVQRVVAKAAFVELVEVARIPMVQGFFFVTILPTSASTPGRILPWGKPLPVGRGG